MLLSLASLTHVAVHCFPPGVQHALYCTLEDSNRHNARFWLCPACSHSLTAGPSLISHIRSKHKDLHNQDVQCWRVYLQSNGHVNYCKSTFGKAPGRSSTSSAPNPSSNSQSEQQRQQKQPCNQAGLRKQGTQHLASLIPVHGHLEVNQHVTAAIGTCTSRQEQTAKLAGKRQHAGDDRFDGISKQKTSLGAAVLSATSTHPQPAGEAPKRAGTVRAPAGPK